MEAPPARGRLFHFDYADKIEVSSESEPLRHDEISDEPVLFEPSQH